MSLRLLLSGDYLLALHRRESPQGLVRARNGLVLWVTFYRHVRRQYRERDEMDASALFLYGPHSVQNMSQLFRYAA